MSDTRATSDPRAPRDNPEEMFTPEQNYLRNQTWTKPGPYETHLPPADEKAFQLWLKKNRVPFDAAGRNQDYDMRGFYQALINKDPKAASAVDPNDKRIHYPDYWKTPYNATFSSESQWATPEAPKWNGDQYTLPSGHVIFDDVAGKWFGVPASQPLTVGATSPAPIVELPPVDVTAKAPLKAMQQQQEQPRGP